MFAFSVVAHGRFAFVLEGCHLKCVFASTIAFSLNASLGNFTTVSIKIVSVSHISAVNFIVGCKVHLFEESYDVWFTYVPF